MKLNDRGLTILEMVISLALIAAITVPIAMAIRVFLFLPGQGADEFDVMNRLRNAAQIIAVDARQSETFTAGSNPTYATFTWVDYINPAQPSYTVRYYYSSADKELLRDASTGGPVSTQVMLENTANYSDVSMSLSAGVLTISLTATVEGVRQTFSTSETLRSKPRPVLPVTPSTPSPLTLVWDDFETGDFTGGSGWLAAWTNSGLSSIVSTGFPQQGNYHMLLRSNTGLVSRSINLSGQANVRVQFWAKADNFDPGNTATFQVSSNGSTWTVVRTWIDGQDDNVYRFEDIDISSFSMTSSFWLRFQANMSGGANNFYVDNLSVVRAY